MFEILILGCIKDGANEIFHLPENAKIYIELSQTLNEKWQEYFFSDFRIKEISWNKMQIHIG
jgi:hypothetical protein